MGTHVKLLPVFSKLILAANDFPNWRSFSKDDNRAYDTEEKKAQWGITEKLMLTAALWGPHTASIMPIDQGTCTVSVKY